MLKIIKSEAEYDAVMAELEGLILTDPKAGTPDADRLELLTLLVQDYESRTSDMAIPDPIDALLFRMEQQGLAPRDLIPYLGTRGRVSEILSRKRPLTISMMRSLHQHLGIPARVLLRETIEQDLDRDEIDWGRFPAKEMISRGWLRPYLATSQNDVTGAIRQFFSALGPDATLVSLYRTTQHIRSARLVDEYALRAWTARIVIRGNEEPPKTKYTLGTVTLEFMRELAKLSWSERGPLLACEYLRNHGICLVVEPHLPQTHLDGAAILYMREYPIIGLSLRYDRIDNFWFCLMHELAHVALHMGDQSISFFDDLDAEDRDDAREQEADALAGEALIPQQEWKRSAASRLKSPEAAEHLAKKLGIHPAIVAGRMRHELNNYRILNNIVGHKQVRRWFTDINWEDI